MTEFRTLSAMDASLPADQTLGLGARTMCDLKFRPFDRKFLTLPVMDRGHPGRPWEFRPALCAGPFLLEKLDLLSVGVHHDHRRLVAMQRHAVPSLPCPPLEDSPRPWGDEVPPPAPPECPSP